MNLLNSKSIGRTLKERRLQLGYTQELAAEKLGITVIKALSLPGKVAPKEAGEIIKNTIYNMMEE